MHRPASAGERGLQGAVAGVDAGRGITAGATLLRASTQPLLALLADICGFDAALPYTQRLLALQAAGVGVWDVIGQCERRGSLDADIVRGTEVPNALPELIASLPELELIGCNGGAALQAFQRWVLPQLGSAPRLLALPSTSPANAAWSLPRLRLAWQPVADALAT